MATEDDDLDYNDESRLGGSTYRGTMGTRVVAVKVLPLKVTGEALIAKLKIMVAQEHANVARLIGVSQPEHPDLCLIAEYYPNGNITQYLANNPNVDRRRLVFQTALGMSFLHTERDITHGSLRPSNILVDDEGNACISDCGMVELTPSTHPEAHRYYSPEAWKGTVSKASDVYAFAMSAYEIFTLALPWGVLSEKHIYQLVVYEDSRPDRPDPMFAARVGLSDDIWGILEESWHHEARLRPSFDIIVRLWQNLRASTNNALSPRQRADATGSPIPSSPTIQSPTADFGQSSLSGSASVQSLPRKFGRSPTIVSVKSFASAPPSYETPHPASAPQSPTASRLRLPLDSRDGNLSHLLPPTPSSSASSRQPSVFGSTRSLRSSMSDIPSSWDSRPSPFSPTLPSMQIPEEDIDSMDVMSPLSTTTRRDSTFTFDTQRRQARSYNGHGPIASSASSTKSWDRHSTLTTNQPLNAVLLAGALQAEVHSTRKVDVIDRCLSKVQLLASQSDRDAQKLVTAGIVPTLIFLLKIRAAECTGLELVLATLGLLAHDPLSANTMFRTNTTHTLLELFKASISEEVSVLALWCLNRMCRTAEVASGLIKQGLCRVLLEQGFSPALSTPPIWRMAAYTLGVLIFNDGIAEMVAEQGAVIEIVDLLQRSSDGGGDPQGVCAALYAAARMSRSIKLAKLLAKAGLVPLLAASLATSTDPSVLLWSARATGCLMRPNSGDMARTLLEAGVAHGLARLPSVLSVSEVEPLGSFAFAIQRFSCAEWGSGTRKALVDAGVVDALLAGLRTVADEPYPAIHVEMALAVSFLGDVGGGAIRKEIISAGGITILKRVAAVASPDVAKVCLMAVTSITGNIWTRNAASAKTAMSHNWNGGCPDWHAPCPVKLTVLRDGFDSVSTI